MVVIFFIVILYDVGGEDQQGRKILFVFYIYKLKKPQLKMVYQKNNHNIYNSNLIAVSIFFFVFAYGCTKTHYISSFNLTPPEFGEDYFKNSVAKFGINNYDTLVDIGCSNANTDKLIFKYYPDTYFLLEDIIKTKIEDYSTVNAAGKICEFKNSFSFCLGKSKSIPLPSSKYKKVLCLNTLHEFTKPKIMLSEIHRIMSKDAVLIILETKADSGKSAKLSCGVKPMSKDEIIELLSQNSFQLNSADTTTFNTKTDIKNTMRINYNILTFSKINTSN